MQLHLQPGNVLLCRINSHRSSWDGSVCKDAEHWNCSAPQNFREDYCARGDDRCFHVNTFRPADPSTVIEQNGAGWLLDPAPHALDDQLLLFWGSRASTALGIPDRDRRDVLFGAYRVRTVQREDLGHRSQWRVQPYDDAWVCFAPMNHARPYFEHLGGPYLKQIKPDALRNIFSDDRMLRVLDGDQQQRFRSFGSRLDEWLEIARDKAEALHEQLGTRSASAPPQSPRRPLASQPFKGLDKLIQPSPAPAKPVAQPAPEPARATAEVLAPEVAEWIRGTLGEDLLLDLRVALVTRDLIVLRGEPGVGKSHLALRLLSDPERERTLVVPVSATWRGREDLLGYVNPMDGRFVKTPFTRFLESAAIAWREGDRSLRVVVFEEFNLSQPEHWFADILAVSQYDREEDRYVQLAGTGADEDATVFLSPSLRFVGTVNSDHTTRPLSPRVLDRTALVHLELGPKQALARVGLELDPPLVDAIADLDFRLRKRGASFSIRTARSLQQCLDGGIVAEPGKALDLVLSQQVLSKVRLTAHDPTDARLLEELEQWCDKQEAGLTRCVAVVSTWRELLDAGLDVVQA